MNKYIKWGIAVVAVILFISFFVGRYNSMVEKQLEVTNRWAKVEAQYQRRADLIPNLVATVKGYANHEQQTLIETIAARATGTQIKLTAEDLSAENLKKFEAAQAELSQGLGRLLAIGESYPDLKASANFLNLQDELAGTENRIAKHRIEFNDAVKDYNTYIRKFPSNLLAGVYGFESMDYYEANEGAENAPAVEF